MKALKKTPNQEINTKKKEIMKLTILNPSFKNETIVYKNPKRIEIGTPDKHEVMSAQLEDEGKGVFSSKNSAYSSVVSKRRSKNERKLGSGSFGGGLQTQSFLAKINQGSPIHTKSMAVEEKKTPSNRVSKSQRRL
jgi:C-terminal processing protease CtpA/Prc